MRIKFTLHLITRLMKPEKNRLQNVLVMWSMTMASYGDLAQSNTKPGENLTMGMQPESRLTVTGAIQTR